MGERQVVDIPLVGGLQEKTDEPYLEPTAQVTAFNNIWVKRNALEKRPGWLSLPNSVRVSSSFTWVPSTLPNTAGLFPHPTATYAVTDGTNMYASADPGAVTWLDQVPPCVGTRRSIASSTNGVANPETAEVNGIRVVVWEDAVVGPNSASGPTTGNTLYYALMKTSTMEVFEFGIIDKNNLGYQPHLTVNGTVVSCWWQAGPTAGGITNRNIYAATLDLGNLPTSPGWRSLGAIVNNSSPGQGWDVAAMSPIVGGNTTTAAIVYTAIGAGSVVTVLPLSLSGTFWTTGGSSFTVSGEATQTTFVAMGLRYQQLTSGTAILYLSYAYPSTSSPSLVRLTAYNVTIPGLVFTQNFSPTTIKSSASGTPFYGIAGIGIETYGSGGHCVVVVGSDQNQLDGGVFWTTSSNAGSIGTTNSVFNLQLLSRPFAVQSTDLTYGVRIFAAVGDVTSQVSHFLAEFDIYSSGTIDSPRPVCTIAPRLNFTAGGQLLRSPNSISSATNQGNTAANTYAIAGTFSETSNNPANFSALAITFDFAHPARFQSTVLGNLVYTSGGLPSPWDGINVVESSSLYNVSFDTLHGNAAGGSLTNNTTYSYVIVPEWRDDKGNVHQGHPSPVITVTVGGNTGSTSASVNGNVKSIALTQKGIQYREALFGQASLYLVPYRSAVIGGSMSQTLFRVVGDNPGSAYLNNPINPSMSFSDTLSDAIVATHPPLYTTGGLVSNDTPSSFAGVCAHNGRMYGIGDDLRTIWISGAQVDGLPCSFSDAMQTSVAFLGDLTAIWSMDDKLFVASQTGIAYMTGSGPNGQGLQSDLSPPTAIPSDVGVVSARAWCVTPIGTVFQHAFGLGLLDRSLSVHSEFGDPVTDILKTSTVTGIVLHPSRPEILVMLNPIGGGSGQILSYNYRFSAWSNWFVTDQAVSSVPMAPSAGLVAGGRVYAADGAGGLVATESNLGVYYDAVGGSNTWITVIVQTGWLKPGGLQGWGKLLETQILFSTLDQAGLSVAFGYDYNDAAFSTAQSLTAAQISGFADSAATVSRVSIRPARARCESVRIQLQDLQSGAPMTGQGFRWHGVSALIEPQKGLFPLPGNQGA